jgi:hypothetical protein
MRSALSVIKKWLSYREHKLLGRPLTTDEAREVMGIARSTAPILLLEPSLDVNYEVVKNDLFMDTEFINSINRPTTSYSCSFSLNNLSRTKVRQIFI